MEAFFGNNSHYYVLPIINIITILNFITKCDVMLWPPIVVRCQIVNSISPTLATTTTYLSFFILFNFFILIKEIKK